MPTLVLMPRLSAVGSISWPWAWPAQNTSSSQWTRLVRAQCNSEGWLTSTSRSTTITLRMLMWAAMAAMARFLGVPGLSRSIWITARKPLP